MTVYEENIPKDLIATPHWVGWKNVEIAGKVAKIPINPRTLAYAKVNDLTTWGSFSEAVDIYIKNKVHGIGFVFASNDPFIGIDLDKCLHPNGVHLTPEAWRIVTLFDSYTEISPSRRGLHIIIKGDTPYTSHVRSGLEIYKTGRYFTITSELYCNSKPIIQKRAEELKTIFSDKLSEKHLPANLSTCPLCPTFAITGIHSPKCPRFKSMYN